MQEKKLHRLVRDLIIVFFSILLAILLVKTGTLDLLVRSFEGSFLLSAFFAGTLFTSVFTTAIGIAAFIVLGTDGYNPFLVAYIGAFGALFGDTIIYRFVKADVCDDIEYIASKFNQKKLKKLFHSRLFYWITPLLGGLIIASPLPDELGISFLALSKLKFRYFLLISYVLNFIGILAIISLGELF